MKTVFLLLCLFVIIRYLRRSRRLIVRGQILDFNWGPDTVLVELSEVRTKKEYTARYPISCFQKREISGRFEIYTVSNGLDFQIKPPIDRYRDLKAFETFLKLQGII